MKESYTIGDMINELAIRKETIRYYEKIGLLSKPKWRKTVIESIPGMISIPFGLYE